ncbi:MAG: low specificity L-threonine aldolase, partial [Oscillospiraceae bacterium]|nr:low specificity L-threonine aldolase [Oscillospiraceae bacterium]
MKPGFRNCMKQQGAILAKGRLLGVQFEAILKDGLYLELAAHANRLAERITAGLTAMNLPLLAQSPSNQVFPILPDTAVEKLREEVSFEIQERVDDTHTCIRFVTAWNSSDADVTALLTAVENALK